MAGSAYKDQSVSLKDNMKNSDNANPNDVIDKSKAEDKIDYVELTSYDSEDVSAYIFFRMFKYKRGRQEGRSADPPGMSHETASILGGAAGGAALGYKTGGVRGAVIGGVVGGAVPAVIHGGAGVVNKVFGTTFLQRDRDKTDYKGSIVLPLTSPINHGYQVNWDSFDSILNANTIEKVGGAALKAYAGAQRAKYSGTTSRGGMLAEIASSANDNGPTEYINNVVANEAGEIFNPDSELILQGISLRRHAFEFLLTPRNKEENEMILKAIRMFKIASHPSKGGIRTENSSSNLVYPYEFSIHFMDGRRENYGNPLNIPPIPDCACTNIEVTYNPQGVKFHADGSPVQYRITVAFTEHQTLTRDDLEEGGF